MLTHRHWLIVGAGLAGSQLAYRLMEQGEHVTLVDANPEKNTSRTAAGLINPITGMRLVKTDGFDKYFAAASHFYSELQRRFKQQFFYPLPMLRLFQDENELYQYHKRQIDEEYQHLLGESLNANSTLFNAPLGGVYFRQSGYLDTSALLDCLHQMFREKGQLLTEPFDYQQLHRDKTQIKWQDKFFDTVIFCEGYHLHNNPWFNYLPLQAAKGEIVSLQIDNLSLNEMVNRRQWIVPRQDGSFRFGATHYWHTLDERINQPGVNELLTHFSELFRNSPPEYQLKKVEVGVRPATRDRQPFVGNHPEYPQLAVFNGFGAKGSLLVPWFSERMIRFLLHQEALPVTADIRRYNA